MVELKICFNLIKYMKKTGNVIKPKFPSVIKPNNIHGTMVKIHYCMLSENIQNTLICKVCRYPEIIIFSHVKKYFFFDALLIYFFLFKLLICIHFCLRPIFNHLKNVLIVLFGSFTLEIYNILHWSQYYTIANFVNPKLTFLAMV